MNYHGVVIFHSQHLFFISVGGLDPDFEYDFRVVAVDGDHETPSEAIPVYTYSVMPSGYGAPGGTNVASSGWFVGTMLAVVFLIIVCVIGKLSTVCLQYIIFFLVKTICLQFLFVYSLLYQTKSWRQICCSRK